MLAGLSGSLLSHYFAEHLLFAEFAGRLGEDSAERAHKALGLWWRDQGSHLGPASSLRALTEQAAAPLANLLGFELQRDNSLVFNATRIPMVIGPWDDSLDSLWRNALRAGIAAQAPWCVCTNGHVLRIVDTARPYSRAYVQFDVERILQNSRAFAVMWGVLRAEAFRTARGERTLVHQIAQSSALHGAAVSRSLRLGVIGAVQHLLSGLLETKLRPSAVRAQGVDLWAGLDEALTLAYRILFLMFAEARGLVPNWHPIYRDHYTIESLRDEAERSGKARGLWEALQAISRLAHRGCRAGTLIVPAFNGRLFSPAHAPLAESCAIDDERARAALLALSTGAAGPKSARIRIDYRDLGVEQLGAVYESVLEYEPALIESHKNTTVVQLRRGGGLRKATGSFYTPQPITEYLVRRTLYPLVKNASAEEILRLRVADPSMGSAAFLVAACRYLAFAYERALLRDGEYRPGDIDERDRACFRRLVAQRCLFGADLNPTAVQLARLSLWLATLAADRPLTFLDHHLVCGDSLIGASPADLGRQPPPGRGRAGAPSRRSAETPLFSELDLEPALAATVIERRWLTETPDDTLEIVREKERRLGQLTAIQAWKDLANLWCACWMWPERRTAPDSRVFASLADYQSRGRSALPWHAAEPILADARRIASDGRFIHWTLEFPEVYFDASGQPLPNPGFDAVLGNPPWDMIRADDNAYSARADGKDNRHQVAARNALIRQFVRGAGIYRHQGRGHLNRYQLFVERALMLTKKGGRIGIVLPSGFGTDHTSSRLRRRMVSHWNIDSLTGVDNRRAIFPIHRSVRFILLTATNGEATDQIPCRFGIDDPSVLDGIPDEGDRVGSPAYPIRLSASFLARLAGRHLTIPELRTPEDLSIVEKIVDRFPRLGAPEGWSATFGRELNATDDRAHFLGPGRGLPILEGKHVDPFVAHVERSTCAIPEEIAARLLDPALSFKRARLAYRDVASSTNRLSLIAAVLPAGVVTTHSLFCLKTCLERTDQDFLCGMLNSFVANYLVRQVTTTHLGSTTVEELRVPRPASASSLLFEISELATRLGTLSSPPDAARLQALCARAYGLSHDEFRHILTTFPLIPDATRADALSEFSRCGRR